MASFSQPPAAATHHIDAGYSQFARLSVTVMRFCRRRDDRQWSDTYPLSHHHQLQQHRLSLAIAAIQYCSITSKLLCRPHCDSELRHLFGTSQREQRNPSVMHMLCRKQGNYFLITKRHGRRLNAVQCAGEGLYWVIGLFGYHWHSITRSITRQQSGFVAILETPRFISSHTIIALHQRVVCAHYRQN